ncbi:uncharacterized protein LOC120419266 isoform X2 [Culex pipiens pallens]|uniref:uncharacterized protein LOC120419266 isoform X2 n=1 Tax=Culex pipiens pallens TaxID=42434 RepID=UPI001952FD5F|nr:uncharacterized protein LOC120419266 isoform X2 [Culex pipiens pallens]
MAPRHLFALAVMLPALALAVNHFRSPQPGCFGDSRDQYFAEATTFQENPENDEYGFPPDKCRSVHPARTPPPVRPCADPARWVTTATGSAAPPEVAAFNWKITTIYAEKWVAPAPLSELFINFEEHR